MLSLRVAATNLDALRRYRDSDDAELSDLLAQLRWENPPTPAMLAGTALHSALELLREGEHDTIAIDGYTFEFAADAEIDIPAIREMKATRDYLIDDVLVTLVGRVDAIHGRRIDDHKFTSRYDPERFLNSFQWRVYLEVFGADEFRWNIFEGRARPDAENYYVISAIHTLTMHRYPGMTADLDRELREYVEFARVHLPEKLMQEAA